MENLTDLELQALYNKLRGELVRKKGNEKATPKHLIPSLYKEIAEINNRMNEIRAEAGNRGLQLS
jgi:hypothetical protein